MIEGIINSVMLLIGIFAGEAVSSQAFGTMKDVRRVILEMVLFVVFINVIMFSVSFKEINIFLVGFIYFIISFFSIISVRSMLFLIFRTAGAASAHLTEMEGNKRLIRMAKSLLKNHTKKEVIALFRRAGYGSELLDLFEKVLHE